MCQHQMSRACAECGPSPAAFVGTLLIKVFSVVLQAHEAMDALKDNLREEHVIVYEYLTSFHQAG